MKSPIATPPRAAQMKVEKRLLGVWRSDRQRTLKDWIWRRGMPRRKRRMLASIFGHLTLRYTRQRVYSDYRGHKEVFKYEVLASDADSAAVVRWDLQLNESRIWHIHFVGDRYWISIGRQREWFRRIRPNLKSGSLAGSATLC